MPVMQVTCPKCKTILRPSKPLQEGKKVKCPKCATLFTAKNDEQEIKSATKAASKERAKGKPQEPAKPAASAKPLSQDDEDGPAVYGVIRDPDLEREEEEEEEIEEDEDDLDEDELEERQRKRKNKKEKLSVVVDLSVKDLRGPAVEAIMRPSNWLMRLALIGCITNLIIMGVYLIPVLLPVQLDENQLEAIKQEREKFRDKPEELKKFDAKQLESTMGLTKTSFVFMMFGIYGFCFAYYALIIYGVFKMQTLESYTWSVVACILGLIPLAALIPPLVIIFAVDYDLEEYMYIPYGGNFVSVFFASVWCLVTLRSKKMIGGFSYKGE